LRKGRTGKVSLTQTSFMYDSMNRASSYWSSVPHRPMLFRDWKAWPRGPRATPLSSQDSHRDTRQIRCPALHCWRLQQQVQLQGVRRGIHGKTLAWQNDRHTSGCWRTLGRTLLDRHHRLLVAKLDFRQTFNACGRIENHARQNAFFTVPS